MARHEVYKIQNNINGKVYIGISSKGYLTRYRAHLVEVEKGSSFILHNALRKYGEENFSVSLLEKTANAEALKEREKFWIAFHQSNNRSYGYNMTAGGDGTHGRKHSEETKNLIRQKAVGRKSGRALSISITDLDTQVTVIYPTATEACKALNRENGWMSWMRKKHGDFFQWNNKEFHLKKAYVPKPKEKKQLGDSSHLSSIRLLARKAIEQNPEQFKERQREARTSLLKPVQQWSKDGQTFIKEYPSIGYAADAVGALKANIRNCAKGKVQSAKGFTWKYPTT